jgi:hypothetical protein
MKHCLKQREKLKNKFTFITTGFDGPWQNDEVTIKFYNSHITMWGTDDFGMELINACEQDFRTLVNLCNNTTPSINVLKKMRYIFA